MPQETSEFKTNESEIVAIAEKKTVFLLQKILFLLLLLSSMSADVARAQEETNNLPEFAAALANVHRRSEYKDERDAGWYQVRGAGSIVEQNGKLYFLTINHNLTGNMKVITSMGWQEPHSLLQWLTLPTEIDPVTGDIRDTVQLDMPPMASSPDTVLVDPAVMVPLPEDIENLVRSQGIQPLTEVKHIGREDLSEDKYYYVISSYTFAPPPEMTALQFIITELRPSSEEAYREAYIAINPSVKDHPDFATTDFMPDEFLPFIIADAPFNFDTIPFDIESTGNKGLEGVSLCQGASGSVVVETDQPLTRDSNVDISDLTVIGVMSGTSSVEGHTPVLNDEYQVFCGNIGDYATIAAIPPSH